MINLIFEPFSNRHTQKVNESQNALVRQNLKELAIWGAALPHPNMDRVKSYYVTIFLALRAFLFEKEFSLILTQCC